MATIRLTRHRPSLRTTSAPNSRASMDSSPDDASPPDHPVERHLAVLRIHEPDVHIVHLEAKAAVLG